MTCPARPTSFTLSHAPRRIGHVLTALLLGTALLACGDREAKRQPPAEAPPASAETAPGAPAAADTPPPPATPDERRVLAWLDPDSPAVAYMRLPADLEPEAIGELFALPPRALALLRAPLSLEAGLAALIGPAAPPPEQWLARDLVVMHPVLARGPYLVRRLLVPRADVEGWLRAGGLDVEVVEGLSVWTPGPEATEAPVPGAAGLPPALVFPWRLVFLADDLIGAFSLTEIGHGLGPLTAARDLPPSELSRTIGEVVAADPALLLELYVQGSMLHFDLSDDVGIAKLSLRRHADGDLARSLPRADAGGLDGEVILQPLGDVSAAAAALEARGPAGPATDVLRELYTKVAYSADGPVVRGRLQLAPEDLAPLRRGGGG